MEELMNFSNEENTVRYVETAQIKMGNLETLMAYYFMNFPTHRSLSFKT